MGGGSSCSRVLFLYLRVICVNLSEGFGVLWVRHEKTWNDNTAGVETKGHRMALTTEPGRALHGAHTLQNVQRQWETQLGTLKPQVPVSAFGVGLQVKGARLLSLVNRAHEVRVAHAQRLQQAATSGAGLIATVQGADQGNASALNGGGTR